MLAKLESAIAPTREKLAPYTTVVSAKAAVALASFKEYFALFLPYGAKAFHYGVRAAPPRHRPPESRPSEPLPRSRAPGFIPLVIFLGMRSQPRPKLIDLLTPM